MHTSIYIYTYRERKREREATRASVSACRTSCAAIIDFWIPQLKLRDPRSLNLRRERAQDEQRCCSNC